MHHYLQEGISALLMTYSGDSSKSRALASRQLNKAAITASSRSVSDPEERAASLGLTQEADYTCNQESVSAHVVFYGDEDLTAVLIPGKVNVPLYLDCSPTRIGPECSDGQFTAQFNVLDDTALFYALEDGAPLTCSMAQPDLPPDLE